MSLAPPMPISSSPNFPNTNAFKGRNMILVHSVSSCQYANKIKAPSRLLIRSSNAEGPLRRPSAPIKEATPPLRAPGPPPPSPPPLSTTPTPTPTPTPPVTSSGPAVVTAMVTIEYQRQRAKELQEYFRQKKSEKLSSQAQVFGFTNKNEISNGRWAMFGFAVGLLTEYATGSSFVDQMKIIISNLGIADLE